MKWSTHLGNDGLWETMVPRDVSLTIPRALRSCASVWVSLPPEAPYLEVTGATATAANPYL